MPIIEEKNFIEMHKEVGLTKNEMKDLYQALTVIACLLPKTKEKDVQHKMASFIEGLTFQLSIPDQAFMAMVLDYNIKKALDIATANMEKTRLDAALENPCVR